MHNVSADGTFYRKDKFIFRTDTVLTMQGTSAYKKIFLIMLNPGKSRLLDDKVWNVFENGVGEQKIKGQLILRNTSGGEV